MKFIKIENEASRSGKKNHNRIKIINLDEKIRGASMIKHRRHGDLLPNSIRAAIVGASNCGKTNLMINLVTQKVCIFKIYTSTRNL